MGGGQPTVRDAHILLNEDISEAHRFRCGGGRRDRLVKTYRVMILGPAAKTTGAKDRFVLSAIWRTWLGVEFKRNRFSSKLDFGFHPFPQASSVPGKGQTKINKGFAENLTCPDLQDALPGRVILSGMCLGGHVES